jgi:hypothetical protein
MVQYEQIQLDGASPEEVKAVVLSAFKILEWHVETAIPGMDSITAGFTGSSGKQFKALASWTAYPGGTCLIVAVRDTLHNAPVAEVVLLCKSLISAVKCTDLLKNGPPVAIGYQRRLVRVGDEPEREEPDRAIG